MEKVKQKIIVILGQTATGKSDLAVKIAKKINGEIVSADSRQVYKGLDIGTGKITKKEMRGIPHYMLDVVSPRRQYTVAEYKKTAEKIIRNIVRKGKIPIIVGGTGFYIDTLLGAVQLPNIPPNKKLRARLQKKTVAQLFAELTKHDPRRAKTIDKHNKVRLIRALEIVKSKRHSEYSDGYPNYSDYYNALKIGIKLPDKKLKQNITIRLFARIRDGMVAEAKKLHAPAVGKGLSWKRMEELGMGYRCVAHYLRKKIDKKALKECIFKEEWKYAKRQKTWFKRDKNIHWFTPSNVEGFKPNKYKKIQEIVKNFLL